MVKKLLKDKKTRKWLAVVGVTLIVLGATWGVSWRLDIERRATLSSTALQFEKDPSMWLSHPKEISHFQAAAQKDEIAAAALAFPWVMYTTKTHEKFAAKMICASRFSCDELTSLPPLSVEHKFPLAALDVDTRTFTEKALDNFGEITVRLSSLVLYGGLFYFLYQYASNRKKEASLLDMAPDTRFSDIIGAQEAKSSLERVRTYLQDPQKYAAVGARAPRGVLFAGPPGTGKTLLARALAGECGANFISVDGSYFTSMFYGAGVTKVKSLFEMARKNAPCILFIDEIDGIGHRNSRADDASGGAQEGNRIINRVLVEMDGFSEMDGVIVVAATNHLENVDPALRRAGRFDFLVNVHMPNLDEREALFTLYLSQVTSGADIDARALARMSAGMSPADIANLVNKAASSAADCGDAEVRNEHLMRVVETHQLGGEVSSLKNAISAKSRRRIAVHEAGHALVAHVLDAGSVDRISIEPRGPALGVTYVTRNTEDPLFEARELQANLAVLLAGREAELAVFRDMSSGAADDLERATSKAVEMVGKLGFGSTFGLVSLGGIPKELLGPELQQGLLNEVRKELDRAQRTCAMTISQNREVLDELVARLLEAETMGGQELRSMLDKALEAPASEEAELPFPGRIAA